MPYQRKKNNIEEFSLADFASEFVAASLDATTVANMDIVTFAEEVIFNGEGKLYITQRALLKAFYHQALEEEERVILQNWTKNDRSTWVENRHYSNLVLEAGRGCPTADSYIVTSAGTLTYKELHNRKNEDIYIYTVDPKSYKVYPTNTFSTWDYGLEDSFYIELTSGKSEKVTYNHPYLVKDKNNNFIWKEIKDLVVGERVAVINNLTFDINKKYCLEWEEIKEIKSIGLQSIIGFEVQGTHIIGNSIVSHNSSKSTLCSIILLYEFIKLILLENPAKSYDLLAGSPIAIMAVGQTEDQIVKTLFKAVKGYAKGSNYIKSLIANKTINVLEKEIRCDEKNVTLMATHTNSDALRGFSIKCLVLDEAAFFGKDELGKFKGDYIYSDVGKGVTTRFGSRGIKIAISSAEGEGDYIQYLYNVSKKDPNTLGFRLRTWDINLAPNQSESFLKSTEEYTRDPVAAALEFEGIRTGSKGEFISKYLVEGAERGISAWDAHPIDLDIKNNKDSERHYVGVQFTRLEKVYNQYPSFIHIDFGIKKDSAALCCVTPVREDDEWRINIDGYLVWKPYLTQIDNKAVTRAVSFLDVEQKILDLTRMRNVQTVSFDIYQSQSTIQRLHMLGINTIETGVSTNKQIQYFTLFKQLLSENRVIMPRDNIWQARALLELTNLVQLPNGKITHHSEDKDLSDAIVNSCYQCYIWMCQSNLLPVNYTAVQSAQRAKGHYSIQQVNRPKRISIDEIKYFK